MAGKKTSVIQVMIAGDSSDLQRATRGGVSGFQILGAAAVTAAKVIASAATAIAGFSIREFAKFDDAMVKSTAIMGDLSDSMKKDMSDAAREVALSTTFAADEAAEAFFFLASAGLSAEQSIAALPQVARFAQAGAFDLALATDLLTDAQSALGMTSEDTTEHLAQMARISDVLVGANTLANASVEQFSAALTNKAGPALRIMNKSVEEGVAALALLADRGIKGTEAGEKLSIMMRDVTRAAARAPDEFRALGLEVLDTDGNLRNLADVTDEFTRVLGGMSDAQAASTLESLGLTRSVGDVIRTMFGGADQMREYESALMDMAGVTEEVSDKQLQSFSAQLSLMRSGISDVAISIGEALAGPLGRLVAWFREQTPAIKAFVEEAIPQVEAFVNRAVGKFMEFKEFYDENLAEPLGNLMERLRTLASTGIGFVREFRERALEFLGDFAQAVAEADSEEAGTVLGQAISDLIVLGFDKVTEFSKFVADWAEKQDWTAMGVEFSKHFGKFVKGMFMGLTHSLDEATGELKFDGSKVGKILVAGLVARIPMVRSMMTARSGVFGIPIIGGILNGILKAARILTPGLGSAAALIAGKFSSLVGAAFGMKFGGTAFAGLVGSAMTALRLLFTGQFATFFRVAGTKIVAGLSSLGATMVGAIRGWFPLQIPALSKWGSAIATWFRTHGLKVLLRSFARLVAGVVAATVGWPVLIVAAAIAAFALFIARFRDWFNRQDTEFESLGSAVVEFIAQGFGKFAGWFDENIAQWFRDRIAALLDFTDRLKGDYENIGSRIIDGMVEGVKKAAGRLMDALRWAGRSAADAANDELEIKSPSRVFARMGDEMMAGMSWGIDRSSMDAVGAMVDASRQISGVDFRAPEVAMGAGRSGAATVNITVTSADPQAVVEALRRYTRANGPLGSVVSV